MAVIETQRRHRVMFVVTAGTEVRAFASLYQELTNRRLVDVFNLSTGALCCDRNSEQPDKALKELEITFSSLQAHKTRNIAKVLLREQPDLVITGSDQEFLRRSFLFAADGLGIPTLLLKIGISSNATRIPSIAAKRTAYRLWNYGWDIINKYLYLLRTVTALRWSWVKITQMLLRDVVLAFTEDDTNGRFGSRTIAVSGPWERQVMVSRGVDPGRIVIVGNPAVNSVERNNQGESHIRHTLGISDSDKVVLFLTCSQVEHGYWTHSMRDRFINGVINSITPLLSRSGCLVIKIHPVESLDEYERIVGSREPQVILRKDIPLTEIIQASDVVVIGGYSMTVLEASVLGKPVVIPNIFGEIEGLPYAEMGVATTVRNLDELQVLVEKLLYDRPTRDSAIDKARLFCEQNTEFVDGKAVERLSNLVVELAKTHRRMNLK